MIVVIVSADSEWRVVRDVSAGLPCGQSPYGDWISAGTVAMPVVLFNGGWGKIAAAASAQYAINRWGPAVLVNIGTCGGLGGRGAVGDVIVAGRTVVYDMVVEIGDPAGELLHYTTDCAPAPDVLALLPWPVRCGTIVSGDRDLQPSEVAQLAERFEALAADWESAAIAYVARRNAVPCLVVRGVSDVVGEHHADAYDGRDHLYHSGTDMVMRKLLGGLPRLAEAARLLAG